MPESIHVKSYFSGTVEAAIDLARRELGEDALLIHAREATPETRRYGAYEVVFGVTHQPAAAIPPPLPQRPVQPPPLPFQPPVAMAADPVAALAKDLAELRRQIVQLTAAPLEPVPPATFSGVRTEAALGRDPKAARVMLVGPPGVGKTSTVVKLAGRYGVHQNKSTHILTTDIYRVAATDQLLTLSAILGAGCEVVEPLSTLPQKLSEQRATELVIVDTPGFALKEMGQSLDLVRVSSLCSALDVHLVLSASMKPADALRQAEAYSIFRPAKLIFTRLDETRDFASLAEVAGELALPVSFLSTGPRIPEEIEPATRRKLADLAESGRHPTPQRKGAHA